MYLVVFWIHYQAPGSVYAGKQRKTMESLWAIWVSNMLAAVLIAVSLRVGQHNSADATHRILLFYPLLGILTGLAFFTMAPLMWQRLYWYAAAIWLISTAIGLASDSTLQFAPLIFGAVVGVAAFTWGLRLKKVAQGLQTSKERQRHDSPGQDANASTAIG